MNECPNCEGEGYFYIEQVGRHVTLPYLEVTCIRCGGLGLVHDEVKVP